MSAFDRIIGYEDIKEDMLRTLDVFQNFEKYEALGVQFPAGMALIGSPGIGKTSLAEAFLEESGAQIYVIRKDRLNGEFINHITETFDKAAENGPAVILLDDMDKYANEDSEHLNAEEYVTVQTCIDKVKGKSVLVIATMNDVCNIPDSLMRVGRFDKQYYMNFPDNEDTEKIIRYYLGKKKVSENIDVEQIVRLAECRSCAELELLVNNAGLVAAYRGSDIIEDRDLRQAWRERLFKSKKWDEKNNGHVRIKATHECGHAIVAEYFYPGIVNYVSVNVSVDGNSLGCTSMHNVVDNYHTVDEVEKELMITLGGKAATEIVYGETCLGNVRDMEHSFMLARSLVDGESVYDFRSWVTEIHKNHTALEIRDITVQTIISKCYNEAKKIVVKNRKILEMLVEKLMNDMVVTYKDIAKIKKMEECK